MPKQTLNSNVMHVTKVLVRASCKVVSQEGMPQGHWHRKKSIELYTYWKRTPRHCIWAWAVRTVCPRKTSQDLNRSYCPSGESSRIVKSVLQSVYNVWCYNYRCMTLELLIRTYPWCTWQIPSVEHLSNNFPMKKEEEMQRKTLRVSTWSSTFSVWDDMEWHSHSYWIRPGHGRIKDHYNRRLAR